MYFVLCDWVSEEKEWYEQRSQKIIAVNTAAAALELAHNIAYNRETSEKYENPINVTIFYNKDGVFNENDYCLCSYIGCDKYSKRHEKVYLF